MPWPIYFMLDAAGNPVPCDDVVAWGHWFKSHHAERVIARDMDEAPGAEAVKVSTVFIGLNHQFDEGPPVLWETLVFGGRLDGEMQRYCSREEALEGHQAMCRRVGLRA